MRTTPKVDRERERGRPPAGLSVGTTPLTARGQHPRGEYVMARGEAAWKLTLAYPKVVVALLYIRV